MITFRAAQIEDIHSITEIYNEAVLNTTATFDTEIKTIENRTSWFLQRDENFPVIVVEYQQKIVGYAALNKWSDKKAYDITAEISLYIAPDSRGKGIGKKLIEVIVTSAIEHTNLHSLIARITQGNEHSIYLHQAYGFEKTGVMKSVGKKFGKLLDVTLLQKMLR
ncbi:MAG: N-acetyltransferase family protein [Bacteroidota bacterium]|nr:N-acetyltransferase family protein [Bacteroidota bacterium]